MRNQVPKPAAIWSRLLTLATALVLQACGGADSALEAQRQAPTWTSAMLAAAQASPSSLPGTEGRRASLAARGTISTDQLLDWAERSYPDLFPKGPATQRLTAGGVAYTVRYYPGTGNYVGVTDDGGVWGYGPFTSNTLRSYGQVAEYTCLVSPGLCDAAPVACKTEITTGFAGDLNATYQNAGVGADGGADGGSAGVGGSEGKVLGGRIKVIRLSDGVVLGEGVTDRQLGLTTIKWCKADMPVMLEMSGAPGAKYFDEAVNDLVDFPLTQKLRALVDRFDENVGVSALTEGAYMYAMNNIANDPALIKSGIRPLVRAGVPVGITTEEVGRANALVLSELNRQFTDALGLDSITTLATPIDSESGVAVLPRNRYGRFASTSAALAIVARMYNFDSKRPAIENSIQVGLDLSDGRIDGQSLSGGMFFQNLQQRTYDTKALSHELTLGRGKIESRFGNQTLLVEGEQYIQREAIQYFFDQGPRYTPPPLGTLQDQFFLAKDGSVLRLRYTTNSIGEFSSVSKAIEIPSGVRRFAPPLASYKGTTFMISISGEVWGVGSLQCGVLGIGEVSQSQFQLDPIRLPISSNVLTVIRGTASDSNFAITDEGRVYGWGMAGAGLLGDIDQGELSTCKFNDWAKNYGNLSGGVASFLPRIIPSLREIKDIAIASRIDAALAVTRAGALTMWGDGAKIFANNAKIGENPFPGMPAIRLISAAEDAFFALDNRGNVWGWGKNEFGTIGQRTNGPVLVPKILDNLNEVVDLQSSFSASIALHSNGSVSVWAGGWVMKFGEAGYGIQENVIIPIISGGNLKIYTENDSRVEVMMPLPRAVRLTKEYDKLGFIGADGGFYHFEYEFKRWRRRNSLFNLPR